MMSMTDLVAIGVETQRIDNGCSLEKEFDGERDTSPSAQETPAVRVQPNRCTKTKEPGFRYTA